VTAAGQSRLTRSIFIRLTTGAYLAGSNLLLFSASSASASAPRTSWGSKRQQVMSASWRINFTDESPLQLRASEVSKGNG
jgi:hypothetical protein